MTKIDDENKYDGILFLDFNYQQLGYTKEWLDLCVKNATLEKDNIDLRYLNNWVVSDVIFSKFKCNKRK